MFIFVGEYLNWAHPDSKRERLNLKLQAAADLVYRAEHAARQIQISKQLRLMANTMGKYVRIYIYLSRYFLFLLRVLLLIFFLILTSIFGKDLGYYGDPFVLHCLPPRFCALQSL